MTARRDPPRDSAVALQWDGSGAPRVTARGHGHIAAEIIALAERHAIPLKQDPALVQILTRVDLGDEIPAALYIAVAQVIAFAYRLSGRHAVNAPEPPG